MQFDSKLKQLISATHNDYQTFYLNVINSISNFISESKIDDPTEKLIALLKKIIAILKIRRAYMLPIGSDTETCYQQQDVWTYALFTAVLIKNVQIEIKENNALQLTQQIIPEVGLNWLKKHEQLFKCWCDYLNNDFDQNNPFDMIIHQSQNFNRKS